MAPPFLCPYGHPLGPGKMLVGWAPCICKAVLQTDGPKGHRTYQCLACHDHHITSVMYVPEHVGGGHPDR